MDGLEYLSQWNDDDDADFQRPTPLDPEYWRGITHSCEPAREVYYHDPYPVAHPSATYGNAGMNAYPMGGGYQAPMATHRPMTAPSGGHGAYGYPHGVVTSPIHYQSARALPISPVTHDDRFFDGHAGVNASMGWGTIQARSGFTTSYASPQAIKAELRDAFVRAQSFANIQSLLQSFDPSHSGVISLRALQEGLLMVGVNVSGHTLQSIGQLYGTPGSGMVDYFALSRLLDVDPHEWDQIRAAIQGRRGSLAANGFDFTQIFLQNDHTRSGSVPRTIFMSILRDCGLGIPEATLHFMAIHLAAPFDTTSVAYGRFLELIGLGGMPGWGAAAHNAHTFGHRNSWSDNRGLQIHQEAYARPYDPPLVTAAPIRRESYVGSASVEVAMPRHGWICRVCAHQQIEDWVTHYGTYDIHFDSGQYEKRVDEGSIQAIPRARTVRAEPISESSKERKRTQPSDEDEGPRFDVGDKVEAQFNGGDRFFKGTIQKRRADGTYDILYDDSEVELKVKGRMIRKYKPSSPKKAQSPRKDQDRKTSKESESSSSEASFSKGQKVEVKVKGSDGYVKGTVFRVYASGGCDVELETGELEKQVPNDRIRSRAGTSPAKKPMMKSDDEPIRPKRPVSSTPRKPAVDSSSESSAPPAKKFRQGQKIEARYKGNDKYYPGVISRCRLNGTYDVDYDDGEKETAVKPDLIRAKESSSPTKKGPPPETSEDEPKKKLAVGQKVEARYKGKDKYYPGVISRCRLNGTFDIDYDDGEKETGVSGDLVRLKGGSSSPSKKANAGDSSESDVKAKPKLAVGQKIEAKYKGKDKYYPGVISRCRLNGTYDIDYDDGEKETGVGADLVRATSSSSPKKKPASDATSEEDTKSKKKFTMGQTIEAQYKGKTRFYAGVIARCRLNGTYDIDYDDGEKETGVDASLIRARETDQPKKKSATTSDAEQGKKKFKVGQPVEAKYKGKERYYSGVISRCRLNGTYDIDYDDGEKETGVAADLIKEKAQKSPTKSSQPTTSEDDVKPAKKFREGDKVEAQYKGKSKFYPGVISRCRLNGTYDINYDDGEKETGVAAELIRLKGGSASPSKKKASDDSEDDRKPKKLKEGDKVEAQYNGKSKFYPGVISRCRLNGTYDIDYDDGEKETGVAAELIRLKEGSSPSKKKSADDSEDDRKPKKLKEGDKVEAQYKGKSKFYPGVISRCRLNGTYDIDYDDGEKETGVAAELIRLKGGSASPSKKKSDDTSEEDSKKKKFREGEKVEVQYKGKSKYYPGVISRCRLNGTYDINYDDGEKETGVGPELIRSLEASKSPKKKIADDSEDDRKPKKFKEGDKVEAQYKGKSKFYPGVISRCRLNGTYDIDYDDGEKETGVAAELIRSKGGSSSPSKKKSDDTSEDDSKKKKFKEGEKVEAQYKGKSKFYPGVISRCRLNGTYDIDYDDGEKETGVAAELIRSLEAKSPKKKSDDSSGDDRKGSTKFRESEKVEAQYKGKSRFYPGVISRCRLNGTYDIDYDDGEKETGVAPELIRSTEKSSSGGSDGSRKEKKFKEGEKVEAQYKGKIKFYPGVISRCRLNGTYDIDYDDGEKETGVAAELIRSREASGGGSKKLKEGDKVEAQYKGKSKFYPGVISRCRLNGTYDIDYDDGEKETGVAAELIRLKESSSLSKKKAADDSEDDRKAKKFREGDKIEAQYKGKSKFYPGVISRCRLNGTYDIDYDDGEKETGVAAELIRSRNSGDSSARGEKKFREGDKVEAQYKGKSKFYPGVISRCRLNGTYDINYDDGEKETGVAAELIRLKGGSASPSKKKASDDSEDDRKPKKLKEGDKVEAQYNGKSKFYPGVISRCRLNGTYDIDYDDGEKETGVAAELIRLKEGSSPSKKKSADDSEDDRKPKKLKEGDKVEAQYKGKSKFYPGVISRCRLNGTYDIDYDDGEKETGVAAELIRLKGGSASPSKKKSDDTSEEDSKKKKFREGEKVEVQYKGKSKYYPGVISRCRLNGTYDINYDDGEKETGVGPELIRSLEASKSPKKKIADDSEDDRKPKKFKEGDKVEAQYKGKSKFYPGVISRCRLNGTYDIDYDDGEKETGVAAELIRSKGGSSSPSKKKSDDTSEDDSKKKKFKEGEKVEAQYKGKSKFYPGVISRCRLNGTYDIDYDDGEKETGVAAELIRSLEAKSPKKKSDDSSGDDRKGSTKFRESEKVEAQYKGKSRFYPGVISRCRLNGTYDIDYDDGEKETGVAPELIRSTEKSSSGGSDGSRKEKKFKEGEKVEAQYKGKIKFYPGVISRCRLNGTYDIDYDDGEKETGVAAELIRSREASGSGSKKLKEGDKVEAQYKGKSKFYPGVISRCRLNGTYDIDYDDGEKETGVAAELIRLKESSSLSKKKAADDSEDDRKAKKFREGDKIEAQYKGKSKFYPGVISRCRLNGTYDIDYDDGEKETGVAAELIRSRNSGDSSARGEKKFREGDKVEAQYKGKSKFYPGVISRCRLNGTYDINYDDGEKETGVAAELIRLKGGSASPSKKKASDDSEDDRKPKKLKEGDKVEAQYNGKSKFYPGVISRCRLNGTYDIDYDDGEKETGVAAELIRLKEGSSPSKKKSADDSEDDRKPKKLKEGDKVEAQYKGKSKFYPGVISRCRLNGTYDIDYDDGEKETGVAAELIRLKGGSASPSKKKSDDTSEEDSKKKKFREGEKVEVQYKGKSKYYPGVISRCRLNGTYDINYDDGEKETGVGPELIRSLEASKTPRKAADDRELTRSSSFKADLGPTFRVGTRIEALYHGKDKYYKGTISKANADGTYDVEYDDGDKESKVPARNIRPLKTSNFSATAEFSVDRPSRPSASNGARRRSGNSSD
ncbi:hypothetical protein Poli38472_012166 [Pythium oligandrum]|uniref:Uncharacterized protein n=1 Tax=Pythium oligandrum TaxID=41045 RepID=A0A8K1FKF3_PYTOL|nr:hypothetical protein Poli38472_012166 [Pythium oligandrum]|eukprot:TMW67050.1 hypothetical protein Poli38472_012166 [Pythium oligandrum]